MKATRQKTSKQFKFDINDKVYHVEMRPYFEKSLKAYLLKAMCVESVVTGQRIRSTGSQYELNQGIIPVVIDGKLSTQAVQNNWYVEKTLFTSKAEALKSL